MNENHLERIKRAEKEGWILIGEVEWGEHFPFGKFKEEDAYFLFTKTYVYNDICYYVYAFGKNFTNPTNEGWFWEETKRYSIATILTSFISHDLQFNAMYDPVLKSKHLKIRLVGMKDWLYPDEDYLNSRINMDELELKFRTDKPQTFKF